MLKIFSFSLVFSIIIALGACKKSSYDPGTTKSPKASNGWWVTYSKGGTPIYGPVFFSTYNTSADKADSMWIDDLGNFTGFKGKVALNYKALTFSNPVMVNVSGADTLIVANGKIIPKGGHSKSGVATDSLYMEIQISDDTDANGYPDPYGTTYQISGTARTGFIEDDY